MRLLNIGSGSSGNATYIGNSNTHILLDVGISKKRIIAGLHSVDIDIKDLDAIFISHEHIDHIQSLGILERAVSVPVYATEKTIREIEKCTVLKDFDHSVFVPIVPDCEIEINSVKIKPLSIDHDAADPVCYTFTEGNKKAAVVTDLGDYNDYLVDNLKGVNMVLLEANHDVRMLEVGPYPYQLKQRILSKYGHLSNETSGRLLSLLLNDHISHILLGHLSRENNTSDLAKWTVENEIDSAENTYSSKDFDIKTASQDKSSLLMEI